MFAFFVFRRYGLAVPVVLFLVAFVMETILDNKYGHGYYYNHFWSIGLSIFLSGVLLTVIAILVDEQNATSDSRGGGYTSLVKGVLEGDVEIGNRFENLVPEPSEQDMFCYIPFNYCALALIGLGILTMLLQLLPIS
jgi:hypothetical protein